jgi:hypothetical protein
MQQSGCLTTRTRAILTLLALGAIGLAGIRFPAAIPPAASPGTGDVVTYQGVVSRLRAGAPYYPTLGAALRRGGYATREAFNWRTPLLWTTVAAVPEGVPEAVGYGVVFAIVLAVSRKLVTSQQQSAAVWIGSVMLVGAVAVLADPSAPVISEEWAGLLIGVSVWAFARDRTGVAVALGLLALFVRELAAPYCVACTLIAAVNRRWRELGAWVAGAVVYGGYYGWHLTQVWAHRLPTDLGHSSSWLEFGGLRFLLATVHCQSWLLVLPAPLTALALVLIVAGIVEARAPVHLRAASGVYVLFFLVAGKPFDDYWGLVAGPIWAIACGYGVDGIGRAVRAAFASSSPPNAPRSDGSWA